MTSPSEIEAVLEAILFVSPSPVPRQKLVEVFPESEAERVEEALERVLRRYASPSPDLADEAEETRRGVVLDEVAGGLRLVTRPDLVSYLRRFFEVTGRTRLSMAALETLAIVAYRQPVTGPEIQELRGKSSSGVIKTLLEKHLIRISGRREVVGKPFEYATTRDFLLHFGLNSLADLPPLEEFEETFMGDGDFSGIGGLDDEPDREEEILREVARADEADADAEAETEDDEIDSRVHEEDPEDDRGDLPVMDDAADEEVSP